MKMVCIFAVVLIYFLQLVCESNSRSLDATSFNTNVNGSAILSQSDGQKNVHRHDKVFELKKDEIRSHLLQNGGRNGGLKGPSMDFMIRVFEDLLYGKELADAVGHTSGRSRHEVLFSDTVRSFSATRNDLHDGYNFKLPALPKHEHLKMAELRFHDNTERSKRQRFAVVVRQEGHTLHKTFSYKPRPRNGNGKVLDITDLILSSVRRAHGNVAIEIKNRTKKLMFGEENGQGPILVLYTQDKEFIKTVYKNITLNKSIINSGTVNSIFRNKRSTKSEGNRKKGRRRKKNKWRRGKTGTDICKMHDFKVDFDLIGWGPWIIHPKTFNAKVCFGQCPSPIGHEYTPTNHAMLQTLMRMKRPLSAPEPCCVPTKLRPLSMLYFEYEDIVVRHHQDMVAAECGCR